MAENMLVRNTCRWSEHALHFQENIAKVRNKSVWCPNILIWVGLWFGNPSGSGSRFLPSLCNRTKLNCRSELHQSVDFSKCKGGYFYSFSLVV